MVRSCKKCGNNHNGDYGSGKFCSRKCANSRSWSDKQRQERAAISARLHREGRYTNIDWKVVNSDSLRVEKQKQTRKMKFIQNYNEGRLHNTTLKKYLLSQDAKCTCCGITSWQDKPLNFELDHIDGNNKNNLPSNVRLLCPNCHSQTDTWRYRNIK